MRLRKPNPRATRLYGGVGGRCAPIRVSDAPGVGGRAAAGEESVLHVISSNSLRGAEVFAVELSASMEGQLESKVVALQAATDGPVLDVQTLGGNWRSRETLGRLRESIRASSVVVAHGSVTLPATVIAGLGLGTPIIYKNIGDPWFWATTKRRRWQTAALLRRVRFVATLSETAGNEVAACWSVASGKVVVTGGGRDAQVFRPADEAEKRDARAVLGLPMDATTLLFLGSLSFEKRPLLAVDTARLLPDVHLLVAGDGPLRGEVEQRARGFTDRIHVLGPRADPLRLLHAADALILTSASEGLPGVLIEAGLTGLPVVATDVGFVRDVVVDGKTGVVVSDATAGSLAAGVRTVLQQANTMGADARKWCVEHFDVSVARQQWLELIRRAASQR